MNLDHGAFRRDGITGGGLLGDGHRRHLENIRSSSTTSGVGRFQSSSVLVRNRALSRFLASKKTGYTGVLAADPLQGNWGTLSLRRNPDKLKSSESRIASTLEPTSKLWGSGGWERSPRHC